MKKLTSLFLVALLAVTTIACGNSSNTSTTTVEGNQTSDTAKVKVGYLAPTLQTEFMIGIGTDLKAACEERGWEYTDASFDNDSGKAVTAIENMVTGGVNVLLAMVSDESCDDALKAAQEKGVVIIEAGVITDVYDIAVNLDQGWIGEQIGEMAANWVNANKNGECNYVLYTTYQNADMQNRGEGIERKFAELVPNAKQLEIVDIGKDVVGSGTSTTETMLQKYSDLDVLLCYGDAAAVESVEAVKAAGRGEGFAIFACDGTESALNYINNDDVMRGTLAFGSLGKQTAELAERYLGGERFSEPVGMGLTAVTKDNVADFLGN